MGSIAPLNLVPKLALHAPPLHNPRLALADAHGGAYKWVRGQNYLSLLHPDRRLIRTNPRQIPLFPTYRASEHSFSCGSKKGLTDTVH
jgi:hypothetical protein